MIDISSAIPSILSKLKTLDNGHYIELLTYKKDRSIQVVKKGNDEFLVIRKGYEQEQFQVDPEKLKKILKSLLKKEFPRSNKVHIKSGVYEGVALPFIKTP